MSSFALLVLSILATSSGVSAQSSSSITMAAASSTVTAVASTGSSLASYQSVAAGTSTASLSINTALPQSAASGAPSGYSIPSVLFVIEYNQWKGVWLIEIPVCHLLPK